MSKKCLPGLYPRNDLSFDCPASEKKVYDALDGALAKNWYAWHSLKLRTKEGNFAETDFLIADPNRGILILEVKGGRIKKDGGLWHTYDKKLKRSPFKQAHSFRNILLDKFKEINIKPPSIGVTLCFPDTPFSEQPTQSDIKDLVVGEYDLPYMEKILPGLMEGIPDYGKTGGGWIKAVHDMWCESWIPEMNLSAKAKAMSDKRVRLDKEQFIMLGRIIDNDLVLVQGGAGTGKTMLARELAKKEAALGKQVLLLSFTTALGASLSEEISASGVLAMSIGKFAVKLLRDKGRVIEEKYEPEFWNEITLEAAVDGISSEDKRWDTVIVDEGQDMGENEWDLIQQCANKERIWVFTDSAQAFWEDRTIPESLFGKFSKYRLGKPYRCPPGIQALADIYAGNEIELDLVAAGVEAGLVNIVKVPEDEVHKHVGAKINTLIKEGFKRNEIAVLSLRGMGFKENIMHLDKLGGREIKKATDPDAVENIICDSFLRYKGLERPAVIVTDLRYVADKYAVRMNIAVSRAMSVLYIVGAEEEIEKDEVLRKIHLSSRK